MKECVMILFLPVFLQWVTNYGMRRFWAYFGHFGPLMSFQIFLEVAKYQERIK